MQVVKIAVQGAGGRVLDIKGELVDVQGGRLSLRTSVALEVGLTAFISGGGVRNLEVGIEQCTVEQGDRFRLECRSREGASPNSRTEARVDPDIEDYYELLEISPNASPDTIARVYRALAQRFHPDNPQTGDREYFARLTEAHATLADPTKRVAYDVRYEASKALRWKIFDTPEQARGVEAEKAKRNGILSALYRRLLAMPRKPEVMRRHIEELLGIPGEHLEAAFWYLGQKRYIVQGDGGSYRITCEGIDHFEASGAPGASERLLLPEASPTPESGTVAVHLERAAAG